LQKVTVTKALPTDRYGDVEVDTGRSRDVFREWLAKTRPGPNPEGREGGKAPPRTRTCG